MGGKPIFKLYLPFLTSMLDQTKIGKISPKWVLLGWSGRLVSGNKTSQPLQILDVGFTLYFSTSTPNFIKIGLKGLGVISAGVVGWAGRWVTIPILLNSEVYL